MNENTKISLKNAFWLIGIVVAAILGWRQMERTSENRQAASESRIAALETLNEAKAVNDAEMREIVKQNNTLLLELVRNKPRE